MKKVKFILAGLVASMAVACSSETAVEDNLDGQETIAEESQEDQLTCAELSSNYDEYEGKTITLTVYSWGNSETTDGKVRVDIADEKLEGMGSPSVTIDMTDKAKAEKIKKDDKITVTGKVGKQDYGVVHIENPTFK